MPCRQAVRSFIKHALGGHGHAVRSRRHLVFAAGAGSHRLRFAAADGAVGPADRRRGGDRAVVWSRADKPARLLVEWSRDENFAKAAVLRGPHALDVSDLTARIDLTGLPAESEVLVRGNLRRSRFRQGPQRAGRRSLPHAAGEAPRRPLRVVGGDTAGQGWGIDLGFGGMKIYEAMRRVRPDFFIHSGDTIYADGPLQERVTDATGKLIWTNAFSTSFRRN